MSDKQKCDCPLCDKDKHDRANAIAQDVVLTKMTDKSDEVNGYAFLFAAAAIAKRVGVSPLEFAIIAGKCFNTTDIIDKQQVH